MADKSGTTSSDPQKSSRRSAAAELARAMEVAAKQPEYQEHFSGKAPRTGMTRGALRAAMYKAGTLAQEK